MIIEVIKIMIIFFTEMIIFIKAIWKHLSFTSKTRTSVILYMEYGPAYLNLGDQYEDLIYNDHHYHHHHDHLYHHDHCHLNHLNLCDWNKDLVSNDFNLSSRRFARTSLEFRFQLSWFKLKKQVVTSLEVQVLDFYIQML